MLFPHLMLLVCVQTVDLHTGRPSMGCGWLCIPSESSHWSTQHGMWLALHPLGIFTLVDPARGVVGSASPRNLDTGRPSTGCGWLSIPSESSHWSTQHGMWLAQHPLGIFTLVDPARDVVGSASPRNLHTGRPSTGCGWLSIPSESSHWSTQHEMWLAQHPLGIFTLVDPARDVVGSASPRNLHTGRPSTGCGWLCIPSESSHWSTQHGMWLALHPLGIFTLVGPARDVVGSASPRNLHTG